MIFESQAARHARLRAWVNAGTYRPGVHRDPIRESEYPWFAVWNDGADSFDSQRDAERALREFSSWREYCESEYA